MVNLFVAESRVETSLEILHEQNLNNNIYIILILCYTTLFITDQLSSMPSLWVSINKSLSLDLNALTFVEKS